MSQPARFVEKLATGISGFDFIADGGLPLGRATLVTGSAGSAKTIFASQFLADGIRLFDEPGVFVTFEESPEDIRRNLFSLGWDIADWEQRGKWVFIDATPHPGEQSVVIGAFDLGALLARIEQSVAQVGARRIAFDAFGSVLLHFPDLAVIRQEMLRVVVGLKRLGLTAVLTAERIHEYGENVRHGIEEFVADNVVILRNVLEEEKRRRTLEILKFRGTTHQKGEFPFTIVPEAGVVVLPLSAIELKQKSSNLRISSGNPELDRMCGGGFFRDSIILVSGATGTGKTLMTTEFIAGGYSAGERCLLFAFEESREQLFRNALGWGVDFEKMEAEGRLRVMCVYPETAGLEDHLIGMKEAVEKFKPNRMAVDSLSALERVATLRGFREFVISFTSFIKHHEIAGLFTSTTPTLMGGTSVTETHISTITDSIILLRYVEMHGEMRRGLTVLKMRGSGHDKEIREFGISAEGMNIGKPFRNIYGILSGRPRHLSPSESDRIGNLFNDEV